MNKEELEQKIQGLELELESLKGKYEKVKDMKELTLRDVFEMDFEIIEGIVVYDSRDEFKHDPFSSSFLILPDKYLVPKAAIVLTALCLKSLSEVGECGYLVRKDQLNSAGGLDDAWDAEERLFLYNPMNYIK